jgi:predicted ABC-type ATPase
MPAPAPPQLIIVAGPNGAGKSTAASRLLPLGTVFVNADEIAKLLPDSGGSSRDRAAGRQAISDFHNLVSAGVGFAIETTLSGKALAARIHAAKASGYEVDLTFLYLASPEQAVGRVRDRVSRGGHDIPTDVIHRRYYSGLRLFFSRFRFIVTSWSFVDNSAQADPYKVAEMLRDGIIRVHNHELWNSLQSQFGNAE